MMNWIDIVILATLAYALYSGFRQGLVVQLCSMLGLLLGIWLGIRYGEIVGEAVGIADGYTFIAGLAIVVLATLIVIAIMSRILKGLFKFVGLGIVDKALGALLSLCKYGLILSVLLGIFNTFNTKLNLINTNTITKSKLYSPIIDLSDSIFPALDWTKQQINSGLEKLQ